MIFYSQIKNGIQTIFQKEEMDRFISLQKDGKYQIEIKKYSGKRSNKTLGYFFGGLLPIIRGRLKELGYQMSPDETYSFVINKLECLKTEVVHPETAELLGEKILTASKWSPQLANEAIEELKQYCAEKLQIVLPEPLQQFKIAIT